MLNFKQPLPEKNNDFYAKSYHSLMLVLIAEILIVLLLVTLVMYQIFHRPLPPYSAVSPTNQRMELTASTEPNLVASTLLNWASKAAVAAYTFDFANYKKQIEMARPYFTEAGWRDYQASVAQLIATIVQNQLFVNGVVSGTPVISNQGMLPGHGYTWRIQIPFLVSYISSGPTERVNFTVVITVVKVPTTHNPAGIGIDQFVMNS